MRSAIPILRSFDEAKAKEFYVTFLGFKVDWDHRFAEEMPLYMQISSGDCVLHLSEHHGDCAPGARVRIETPDLDAYLDGLRAAIYSIANLGKPSSSPGACGRSAWRIRLEIT